MKEYLVIEICKKQDGSIEPGVYTYESIEDARERYYQKCSGAVKSEHLSHTIVLMNSAAVILEGPKCFRHEPVAKPEENGGEAETEAN